MRLATLAEDEDLCETLAVVRVERHAGGAAPLLGLGFRLGYLGPGEQAARGDAVVLERLVRPSNAVGSVGIRTALK